MVRFRANAVAGGLLVTLLLALGMAWSIFRLSSNGASQIQQVRAEERQITLAERLRWNVELIVSIGKGYFITEEPELLSRLDHARRDMRESVAALWNWVSSEGDARFLGKLEQISYAHFCVADQGPGVAPEQQPHVFDRFWRSTASAVSGTGLGLFIAKGIVDAHGGKIWVETARQSGARFHFTLSAIDPLTPENSEAPAEYLLEKASEKLLG